MMGKFLYNSSKIDKDLKEFDEAVTKHSMGGSMHQNGTSINRTPKSDISEPGKLFNRSQKREV